MEVIIIFATVIFVLIGFWLIFALSDIRTELKYMNSLKEREIDILRENTAINFKKITRIDLDIRIKIQRILKFLKKSKIIKIKRKIK
jgi:hypothetical protein